MNRKRELELVRGLEEAVERNRRLIRETTEPVHIAAYVDREFGEMDVLMQRGESEVDQLRAEIARLKSVPDYERGYNDAKADFQKMFEKNLGDK